VSLEVIANGVRRFRSEIFPANRETYQALADKQHPFALFLTCGDSRIDPTLLTGTQPGQIFVERTPGNIVPIYDDTVAVGVTASIEYAVAALGVAEVIICGHSACGAMKGLLDPEHLDHIPATERWLEYARPALEKLGPGLDLEELTKLNVIEQMRHLQTHPAAQERMQTGQLGIHGWYYAIHAGTVEAYDPTRDRFLLWP
jgi:carbonic anhydrase